MRLIQPLRTTSGHDCAARTVRHFVVLSLIKSFVNDIQGGPKREAASFDYSHLQRHSDYVRLLRTLEHTCKLYFIIVNRVRYTVVASPGESEPLETSLITF